MRLLPLLFPLVLSGMLSAQPLVQRDRSGRPLVVRYDDGSEERFAYDGAGRLAEVTERDAAGSAVAYTWYAYDLSTGNLLVVEEAENLRYYRPDAFAASGTFSRAGDAWTVRTEGPSATTFHEDEEGNLVRSRFRGEATTTDTYDGQGRLVKSETRQGDAVTSTERTWDAEGNLAQETDREADGIVRTKTYRDGLLREETFSRDGVPVRDVSYADGKVETVYDGGKPYARITYGEDGMTVREVEYL